MLTCSLQSGSHGNCIYVETPDVRLLFDAGISGRLAAARLAEHGRNIRDTDALIISHDHADHVSAAGVFQRKFGLPVYISGRTLAASRRRLGPLRDVRFFIPGDALCFGATSVQTVPTAHDGVEPVAFVVGYGPRRLGIFTDLGYCFPGLDTWISRLHGLYLESNYDPDMLAQGDYPPWLKARIVGAGGHLSNHEAARLIRGSGRHLQWVLLAHLSQENNCPELALETAARFVPSRIQVGLAPRTSASLMFRL